MNTQNLPSLKCAISTLSRNPQTDMKLFISLINTIMKTYDDYTVFHSKNVAYYAFQIGKSMNLPERDCFNLYIGGLLHDLGKVMIPESILNKPSQLTDEEFEIVKTHSKAGYELLKEVPYFKDNGILDVVLSHHERFDGNGYPNHKKGEYIPKHVRIISIADSFDAMTSKRAYKEHFKLDYAMEELEKGKGTQFDPEIVDVFISLLKEEIIEIKGYGNPEEIKKHELPFPFDYIFLVI